MHVPFSAKARSWPSALALSLLLHASLVLSCYFLSSHSPLGEKSGSLLIDTRAAAPVTGITLLLCEPHRADHSSAQPAETPPVVTSPSTPLAPVAPEPVPAGSALKKGTHLLATLAYTKLSGVQHGSKRDASPFSAATGNRTTGSGRGAELAGLGTGNGTTAFFHIATQGTAIVYVIDRSASMGLNGCLATAKRELLASLEHLPSTARFQVIPYNRSAEPLRIYGQSGLTFATPENKRCVALLLEGIQAEGGTEHVPALKRALALGPDVIFFLTDAADLRAEQIRAITCLNHGRSTIHAIELGRASEVRGDLPLYALAQENQGCYKSVPPGP